jgi:hypothetical protein
MLIEDVAYYKSHPGELNKLINGEGDTKVDQSSLVNAALAAKDETIASLRDQLAAKDNVIQAKDELIAALRQQITILQQTGRTDEPFRNYPFEIGVAEESKRPVT